jgi:hypothetical protein
MLRTLGTLGVSKASSNDENPEMSGNSKKLFVRRGTERVVDI